MALAVDVASRSNCMKAHVGAIILHDGRIRSTGYNGTVEGYKDCYEGGCPRCLDLTLSSGEQLDRCVCVHAEENALVSAARYGIEVAGAECYVTHEPCLGCTKLLIQSGIKKVVYLKPYEYSKGTDHAASREAMRNVSERRGRTIFRRFVKEFPRVLGKVGEWESRLSGMKKKALAYAHAKGIART